MRRKLQRGRRRRPFYLCVRNLAMISVASWLVANQALAGTQTKFVGSATSNSPGTRPWQNPTRVTADDGSYSRLDDKIRNGEHTETLVATMSGNEFTIPAGATISGITVTIEFRDIEVGQLGDRVILIVKGGTASITSADDIRIPTVFNMIWEILDLTVTRVGNASSKVTCTRTILSSTSAPAL